MRNEASHIVKRFLLRAFVFALALILPAIGALASFQANVYTDTMKVYSKTSTASKYYLGSLKKNTEFTVVSYSGSWAKIKYKGRTGYAQIKDMISQKRTKMYVTTSTKIYRTASTSSNKVASVTKGDAVYMVGYSGSFYLVESASGGSKGYIRKSYLSKTAPKTEDTTTDDANTSTDEAPKLTMTKSNTAEYAIAVAESLLGRPYSSKPSIPKSFDCSRFVKYCLGQAGVNVSGDAKTQGYSVTESARITDTSKLKRGDIVVFNTNENDSDLSDHTGIYLGGGMFIHASSGAGKVIKSTLNSGYYAEHFSWGIRVNY